MQMKAAACKVAKCLQLKLSCHLLVSKLEAKLHIRKDISDKQKNSFKEKKIFVFEITLTERFDFAMSRRLKANYACRTKVKE